MEPTQRIRDLENEVLAFIEDKIMDSEDNLQLDAGARLRVKIDVVQKFVEQVEIPVVNLSSFRIKLPENATFGEFLDTQPFHHHTLTKSQSGRARNVVVNLVKTYAKGKIREKEPSPLNTQPVREWVARNDAYKIKVEQRANKIKVQEIVEQLPLTEFRKSHRCGEPTEKIIAEAFLRAGFELRKE